MPIKQVRKPHEDQDDEKITMDFLIKQNEIQNLIAARNKATYKLNLIIRQLDCAVQNRALAFRRVEIAELNVRANTSNAYSDLKNAQRELELRNKELDMAVEKDCNIKNLIHELSERFDKLTGKGEPRVLFDEVLIDLHKIFDEKSNSQLKVQF